MIFSDAHFTYMGWTIFAYAAYAFYKITMSIVTLIKAHKQDDLTVRAIRNINLVDALVSILALQTALLTMFSEGATNISLFNTLTGTVVSFASIGIGIYMIVSANKKMKELQKENNKYEQSI
jgi:divalent metal cation (Fe/Co/Zn/Cd) transporter